MRTTACAAAILAALLSAAHAESPCDLPADEYIGMLGADGKCHPIPKSLAKNISNTCAPGLEGRGTVMLGPRGSSCEMKMQEIVGSPCNPPANEYIGMRASDGVCHPIHKSKWITFDDCTPDLEGRGAIMLAMPTFVAGASNRELKCEIPYRPLPQSPLEDLRQEIEQLRGEIQQLREGR